MEIDDFVGRFRIIHEYEWIELECPWCKWRYEFPDGVMSTVLDELSKHMLAEHRG